MNDVRFRFTGLAAGEMPRLEISFAIDNLKPPTLADSPVGADRVTSAVEVVIGALLSKDPT